jgi:hypothetical protein
VWNWNRNQAGHELSGNWGVRERRIVSTLLYCHYWDLSGRIKGAKMPNGRSGGFVINTADLKELVKIIPDETVVGQMVVLPSPIRAASAAEVIRFVEECPHDGVAVEEQDNKSYIVHLSHEPKLVWLVIGSESPIFLEFPRRHAQWKTEHPGWNGWVAF